jgi:transcriptional regulator with XRE-family HTH domain
MVAERLRTYLNYKQSSFAQLERELGLSNGTLGRALRAGKSFSASSLEKILSFCEDLSAEWLLRGKGEMILRENGDTPDKERIWMLEKQLDQVTRDKDNYWSLIQRLTEK